MGMFLALSGVIGQPKEAVIQSLGNYTKLAGGALQKEALPGFHNNCCVMEEAGGNTTIFYPAHHMDWDGTAEHLSRNCMPPYFLSIYTMEIYGCIFYM